MNFGRRKTILSFVFLVGIGTALPMGAQTPSPTPVSLSKQTVQLKVAFHPEANNRDCGLAAAQMVCDYYNQELGQTQQDWLESVSTAGTGIMGSELVTALRAADYETALFPGTLDHEQTGLYYHLDKKRPVIVMITSKDGKDSHYDILTGYDPVKNLLLVLDPAIGPLVLSVTDFTQAWKRANNFTLVAVPKDQMEQTPTH